MRLKNEQCRWAGGIVLALFLAAPAYLCLSSEDLPDVPRVIIVTLIGVRNRESIGDPSHQYIPHLQEMFKEGALYTDLTNDNVAFHMPSVSAMHDGKTHQFYSGDADITTPTIFQYVRKTYDLPATKLWAVGIWDGRTSYCTTDDYSVDTEPSRITAFGLSSPSLQEKKEAYGVLTRQEKVLLERYAQVLKEDKTWPQWDSISHVQYHLLKRFMQNFKPVLVHFAMNDMEAGHYGSFGRYVLALKECDQRVFDMWHFINTDPFYKGKTYFIVTVDCERDLYYMQHYKSSAENPSHVWLYISGPDIKKGVAIDRPVYHKDVFATLAYLMKVKTHPTEGKILEDCFIGYPLKEKKE